jgi:hypothetical protein
VDRERESVAEGAMAERQGMTWVKWGCAGCAGLLGFAVLLVALFAGVAYFKARSERIDDQVVEHPWPAPAEAPPAAPSPAPQDSPAGAPAAPVAGRVLLDLAESEFRIAPAEPGGPIRVEATYDRNAYRLEEGFLPRDAAVEWTYRVAFRRSGSGLMIGLKELISGSRPKVRVLLPRDVPLALELKVARGGAEVELGGLWLRSADIRVEMGGMALAVSEPLEAPVDSLVLRTSMGGADIRSLGNASPRKLDVEYSMGGMSLDLRGQWVADCDATVRGHMGGGQVRLPRDIRVEGLAGRRSEGRPQGEVPPPTLRFTAESSMGDLEFD